MLMVSPSAAPSSLRISPITPPIDSTGLTSKSWVLPPSRNPTLVSTRYMIPMRLWSRVSSQDMIPDCAFR